MSLKQQVLSAGRWTTTSTVLCSGLHLAQTVVLARLLAPADFGLMAAAGAVLAVVGLFSDFGLSRALVHFALPPAPVLSTLYWLNLGAGIALMLAIIAAAPTIAALYQEPALVPVLAAISVVFPIAASCQQFKALAEKELRFSVLASNEMASTGIGVASAFLVAWLDGGVYALVAGVVATATASAVLTWLRLSHGYRPRWHLSLFEARPYLRFGRFVVGEGLANTVHVQADVLIGALALGPASIGQYSLPRDVSLRLARTVVNPVVTRIGFPLMARLQDDLSALKSVYLQTLRMTTSINFPMYVALAVFAEEVVALLFGNQWTDAAAYLRVLAVAGLVRSVGNPIGSLLHAAGRVRLAFWWNVAMMILLPTIYAVGVAVGGLEGLAWAVLISQALIALPLWRFMVYPLCGATLAEYLAALAPALATALLAGGAAAGARGLVNGSVTRLALGCLVGAVVYVALSLKFNRSWVVTVLQVLKPSPSR